MSVGTAARRAIYGQLSSDATLRGLLGNPPAGWAGTPTTGKAIYSEIAPEETGFPYVVFFQTSGIAMGDAFVKVGTATVSTKNDLWTVKAVVRHPRPTDAPPPANTKSAQDAAEDIQARIDFLLTDKAISIAGALDTTTTLVRRESDVSYSEVSDGTIYFHRGCVFRLIWQ